MDDFDLGSNLQFGSSVASCGDMDGDGVQDHIFGVPGLDGGRGGMAIGYGAATGLVTQIVPISIPEGMVIAATSLSAAAIGALELGTSVVCVGDMGGDGVPDVFVTSAADRPFSAGWGLFINLKFNPSATSKRSLEVYGVNAHNIQATWFARLDLGGSFVSNSTQTVTTATMRAVDGSTSPWLTIWFGIPEKNYVAGRHFDFNMRPVSSAMRHSVSAFGSGFGRNIVVGPWVDEVNLIPGNVIIVSTDSALHIYLIGIEFAGTQWHYVRRVGPEDVGPVATAMRASTFTAVGPSLAAAEGLTGSTSRPGSPVMTFLTTVSTRAGTQHVALITLDSVSLAPIAAEILADPLSVGSSLANWLRGSDSAMQFMVGMKQANTGRGQVLQVTARIRSLIATAGTNHHY